MCLDCHASLCGAQGWCSRCCTVAANVACAVISREAPYARCEVDPGGGGGRRGAATALPEAAVRGLLMCIVGAQGGE